MSKKYRTYLSGSIKKQSHNSASSFWTLLHAEKIQDTFSKSGKLIEILNPNDKDFQKNKKDILTRELKYIDHCDFVLVELSQRRGVGVGVEIYHAFLKNIPVYSICPDNTYYRNDKENWLHPIIETFCSKNFSSFEHLLLHIENTYVG